MRAVTGPAAKESLRLELLPSELTTWADRRERHPMSKVLFLETGHLRSYQGQAYASCFANDQFMFPVRPQAERPRRFKRKELLAVVYTPLESRAYAVRDVAKAAGTLGFVEDRLGERELRLRPAGNGKSLRLETADGGAPPPVAYMFWFALSAMQPDIPIYSPR